MDVNKITSFWYGTVIAINDKSFVIKVDHTQPVPFWAGADQVGLFLEDYKDVKTPKYEGQYVVVMRIYDEKGIYETQVYDAQNFDVQMNKQNESLRGLGKR